MKGCPKIRVLLAEDHKVVLAGLVHLVRNEADMDVIGEAFNGREAVAKSFELKPDVVVMDLSMPDLNGLQATSEVLARCPASRVLILTSHEDESYLLQVCKAGAAGFVLKRSAGDELIRAIRAVASGQTHYDSVLAGRALSRQALGGTNRAIVNAQDLSDREAEVVREIAWGYTNKEIAGKLGLSVKTIETYKLRIGEKLGLRSRAEIVRYALRKGWMEHPPADG